MQTSLYLNFHFHCFAILAESFSFFFGRSLLDPEEQYHNRQNIATGALLEMHSYGVNSK
jgi:hypothetical protein